MGQIFLAPSATGPVADQAEIDGLRFLWHAWDGTVWDMCADPGLSGVALGKGIRGLGMPEVTFFTSESASVDGLADRGFRSRARDVFWPLRVWQDSRSQAWIDYDAAWWKTLRPGKYGTWEIQHPSGVSRSLRLRLEDPGDGAIDTDPAIMGWAKYGIRLTAPDPYWRGDPIIRSWTTGTTSDFFNGVSKAPPFNISQASTIATATLTNPGDVDAWPIWTIYGPSTAAELGLAGRLVTVPFTVASGKALVVDTDPQVQTAYLYDISGGLLINPVEKTGDLSTADFAPIPPGTSVSLALSLTGSGTIQSQIIPGWYRAW